MKSFFQTSRLRSFLSACRITGKKWSASVPLLLAALLTVVLYSCRDEDLFPSASVSEQNSNTRAEAENTSGLNVSSGIEEFKDGNNTLYKGYTYSPSCRVPLVGEGRVVNHVSQGLVNVLSNDNKLEYLIDEDLSKNAVSFSGVADVSLIGDILLSVKDVNRVYYDSSNGIKVGFLYKDPGGLLSLNVLQGFWVKTYLKGKEQDGSSTSGSGDNFQLLNLNLLNVSGGLSEISFTTKLPFDEVRIGCGSISVDVLSGLEFYYAFVGENPEKIATYNGYYKQPETDSGGSITGLGNTNNLIDEELDNSEQLSMLGHHELYVDFNEKIVKDSEIGFKTGGFKTLDIDLTGLSLFELTNNDVNNKYVWGNEKVLSGGIGISLLGTQDGSMSAIAKEDCYGVKIKLNTGLVEGLLDAILGLLGNTHYYYAYSRDPVTVDVSSYFSIGNDTISGDQYTLPPLNYNGGTVAYNLVSSYEGVSLVGNQITGITSDGDYTVEATYSKDDKTIIQRAIITRKTTGITEGCNIPMINTGSQFGFQAQTTINSGGQLIDIFSSTHRAENLVDLDPNNYAEYISALSLLQAKGIVAVTSDSEITTSGASRIGFVMQTSNTLLSADVLRYFFIRLYNGSEEVANSLTQTNNTVGVGLLGGDGSQLRFYLETQDWVTFDRVELWTAGLLNLNLNKFRLYYAFYEPTTCENNTSMSTSCMEMITSQKYGAKINYSETGSSSVLGVGSTISDISNVLDNSMTSYATIGAVASVIGQSTIAIKFNELGAGQPVGAIISGPALLADVSLLSKTSIVAYREGTAVADNTTSGGVASIEAIGDDGLNIIEVTPKTAFDEVRITFPSVLDALKVIKVHGFYTRPDKNNNGIPDCAEEPDDQTIVNVSGWTKHVCINPKTGEGIIDITLSGIAEGSKYTADLICYPYNGSGQTVKRKVESTIASSGTAVLNVSLPAGDYSISGLPYNGLRAQVHPQKTTWKRNPVDTDWNNWNNWTDGSPWGCTNVVIPTGATRYPVLESWSSVDEFYGGNYCENIHFEPGAAVLNTQYLEYDCAYVEMEVQSGMYHMISTPLHGMVTGDMFVSPEMPAYFTPLKEDTYREVRHNPIVRQKMYSRAVTTATSDTDLNGTVVATADWSRTFNAVAQPYEQAQGIKVMVGNEGDGTSYRLRFPKAYTKYNYYTLSGGHVKEEKLPEVARNMNGKFAYEESGFKPENAGRSFTFKLRNEEQGATYFVAGNPFMSYLDIKTFLTENKQSVQAIRIIDSENVSGEEEGLVRISLGENGDLNFDVAGEQSNTIAPLQAFYVEVLESYTSDNVNITYTSDMFVQPSANSTTTASRSVSVPSAGEMKISATSEGSVSTCSLTLSAGASDSYSAKEDIVSLIDEDFMPKVKVYTVADKRALDIQKMNNAKHVDLGFVVKDGTQNAEITLNYGSNWKGWTLVDKQTGNRYELNGNTVSVNAGALKSNDSRFYLEKQ